MKLRCLFLILSLCLSIVGLNHRWGMIPPLGLIFSPQQGLWRNLIWPAKFESQRIAGLKSSVSIAEDKNHMFHIFAQSDEDAYFMQGYLVARERLWQIDFQSRLAAGRLSEIMGPKTLSFDRFFIQLQLEEAAERSVEKTRSDAESWAALQAFTQGINSYISELNEVDFPIEYKLLETRPEPWTEEKTLLISKLMAFRLSAFGQDITRTRTALKLGHETFNNLFPLLPAKIIPTYTVKESQASDTEVKNFPHSFWPDTEALKTLPFWPQDSGTKGSNAWAIAGKLSESGSALLANDPHLSYSLPSIWYPLHIQSPSMDVIGYSLVGTPGIIIGSTPKLAWGVTNGYADVADWYIVNFRDATKREYQVKDVWEKTWQKSHLIHIRGHEPEELVIQWTQWGPVISAENLPPFANQFVRGLVFRWTGLKASNEFKTFYKLNRAEVLEDCPEALQSFVAPAQNFVCADAKGRVGIWLGGLIPKKPFGQGRLVLDSKNSNHHWQGFLDSKAIPQNVDPQNSFVFTANQRSIGARYKYELGDEFPSFYRAQSIESALLQKSKWNVEEFQKLQNSVYDAFLCEFKKVVSPSIVQLPKAMDSWDCQMAADSRSATLFFEWWRTYYEKIWTEKLGSRKVYAWPDKARTLLALKNHRPQDADQWIKPLKETLDLTLKTLGPDLSREQLQWGNFRPTRITHIAQFPGLGREVSIGGSADTVMANQAVDGPSMRFIAQLDDRPKIYMALPGGRSGDTSSPHYTNWLKQWQDGELISVPFLENMGQAKNRGINTWEFTP